MFSFKKVDHSRVNEFGFSGDMLQDAENKQLEGTANGDLSQGGTPAIETPSADDNSGRPKSAKAKKSD